MWAPAAEHPCSTLWRFFALVPTHRETPHLHGLHSLLDAVHDLVDGYVAEFLYTFLHCCFKRIKVAPDVHGGNLDNVDTHVLRANARSKRCAGNLRIRVILSVLKGNEAMLPDGEWRKPWQTHGSTRAVHGRMGIGMPTSS